MACVLSNIDCRYHLSPVPPRRTRQSASLEGGKNARCPLSPPISKGKLLKSAANTLKYNLGFSRLHVHDRRATIRHESCNATCARARSPSSTHPPSTTALTFHFWLVLCRLCFQFLRLTLDDRPRQPMNQHPHTSIQLPSRKS